MLLLQAVWAGVSQHRGEAVVASALLRPALGFGRAWRGWGEGWLGSAALGWWLEWEGPK